MKYGIRTPTFMAHELRLLGHTHPDFFMPYEPLFIGGGGGLQFVDSSPLCYCACSETFCEYFFRVCLGILH